VSVTQIPFRARGRNGLARVTYVTNDDPVRWGYPILDLGLTDAARGFPVMQAEVSEFEGEGWEAVMSWLQIVWITNRDDGEPDETIFDRAPQLLDMALPYFSWGLRPRIFDAPSIKGPRHVDWVAHTMLACSPDGVMTKVIQPLCGFSWGYRLRDATPHLTPLALTSTADWSADCALFACEFPGWQFEVDCKP
jgi:hypothetical protein